MACLVGRIGRQLPVKQQRPQQEVAAVPLVDEHGVLAEPAEPGPASEVAFQQRGSVHDAPAAAARRLALYPGQELIQPLPQHVVVIEAAGVTRNSAGTHGLQPLGLRGVVHPHHDDAAHLGEHRRGMAACLGVAPHVIHLAGEAPGEPVVQTVEAVGGRSGGDAGQFKAKRAGLLLEAFLQCPHAVIIRHSPVGLPPRR